jgi:hypothetical protein
MNNIPLEHAIILWNDGLNGGKPAFAIRHIGHPDYKNYRYKIGACFADWSEMTEEQRKTKLMIEIWHVTAFYNVPASLMTEELLQIPEYRDMLADDVLPTSFQHER